MVENLSLKQKTSVRFWLDLPIKNINSLYPPWLRTMSKVMDENVSSNLIKEPNKYLVYKWVAYDSLSQMLIVRIQVRVLLYKSDFYI